MRSPLRIAALGIVLGLGCRATPVPPGSAVVHLEDNSPLHVAFDDISVEKKPELPIRLTASDGSGLALVELSARAVVDDPLAFTELTLVFDNPEDRTREGTFTIVLPQGASISRFAMKMPNGAMQEGEVVEKQQARLAYEDFLHRKQDPALLEQTAGNELSARVFPIPPKGRKELVVSFSQAITARTPYLLPLRGLPEIASVHVEAFLAGHAAPVQTFSEKKLTPTSDFRLDAKLFPRRGGLRNENLVVARVKPGVATPEDPLTNALILLDTSASRALGLGEARRAVKSLCASVARAGGGDAKVVVAAFDQGVDLLYEGPASGFGDVEMTRIRQRLALGASNLDAALAWAGEKAKSARLSRVVLVTDGIPTAGPTGGDALRARVQAWGDSGVERLDAVATGGIRDDDLLKSLALAGLRRGGVVVDAAEGDAEIARRLSLGTASAVEVKVDGADFVFPSRLEGVQPGDEALVFANVPADKPVRISVGGGDWETPDLLRAERPLLERAWVGAKIQGLLERERREGSSDALSKQIVGLSTKFRVLSPRTALLVLENDRDYRRFQIDRTALADILVTDGGQVSLLKRAVPPPPKPPAPPAPPPVAKKPAPKPAPPKVRQAGPTVASGSAIARGNMWGGEVGDSFGAGGLGLTGIGEGGGGTSEGVGLGTIGTIGHGAGASAGAAAEPEVAVDGQAAGQALRWSPGGPLPSRRPLPGERPRPGQRTWTAQDLRVEPEGGDAPSVAQGGDPEPPMDVSGLADPYTGPFKTVMAHVAAGRLDDAARAAFDWRKRSPGDVLALVALGEVFEAAGDLHQAARCYGSVVDLFPARADLRRFAGERLDRIQSKEAQKLSLDTYRKAAEQRPDHPASHRLLAYALLRTGHPEKAFEAMATGLQREYPGVRYPGVRRIFAEDLGLIGAAWAKAEPARAEEIARLVRGEGGLIEDKPSIRFVLHWETDANDVDFHIFDGRRGHAYYANRRLSSGGLLYADVVEGYGPECFTIRKPREQRTGPYVLLANYYARGPMGYGMGKVEVIEHDGKGALTFDERPFVVMTDKAYVDLGTVR
ncbi:MAG: VIT domain-containing protein [Polyangiaceae bacterium]